MKLKEIKNLFFSQSPIINATDKVDIKLSEHSFIVTIESGPRNAMFYITAHTVTQNQFANIVTDAHLKKVDPFFCTDFAPYGQAFGAVGSTTADVRRPSVILLPSHLRTSDQTKFAENDSDLQDVIIADGLRFAFDLQYSVHFFLF